MAKDANKTTETKPRAKKVVTEVVPTLEELAKAEQELANAASLLNGDATAPDEAPVEEANPGALDQNPRIEPDRRVQEPRIDPAPQFDGSNVGPTPDAFKMTDPENPTAADLCVAIRANLNWSYSAHSCATTMEQALVAFYNAEAAAARAEALALIAGRMVSLQEVIAVDRQSVMTFVASSQGDWRAAMEVVEGFNTQAAEVLNTLKAGINALVDESAVSLYNRVKKQRQEVSKED